MTEAYHTLRKAFANNEKVICVHYGCGDFYVKSDQPTPVTCIAVSEPDVMGSPKNERAFSIANSLGNDPEEKERDLLERFYDDIRSLGDPHIVHWNMNSSTYGFAAIAARYRYLFEDDAPRIPDERTYDLDSVLGARFGEKYAGHPKMRSLATINSFHLPFFRMGKEEADALKNDDYQLIERSTASKAHMISLTFQRLVAGRLLTANSVGEVKFADSLIDAVRIILAIGERFRYVERNLQYRHADRPTLKVEDEYDAQDLMRSVLVIFFEDVRPEDYVPTYAGSSSRIDFVLPDYELAIELKFTRDSMSEKDLGEQLLVDRARYEKRSDVRHLVCLVFDHEGKLRNPRGIERDVSVEHSTDALTVTVRIVDR